jgi:hypothetical protein
VSYLVVFLAALTWSGHCVGMCGGFAFSLASPGRNAAQLFGYQLLYHAGKTFTYCFLGVLALALGVYVRQFSLWLGWLAGALLILIGLNALGVFRRATRFSGFLEATPLCGLLRGFMQPTNPLSAFLLGLVNGFLPCPLVYAMLVYVATLTSVVPAVATMAVFGAGTIPALVAVGAAGGWLRHRLPLMKVSGGLTLALGVVTILRGFDFFHAVLPGHCCH